ncbi:MAG: acetamidase/formamidase family protein [Alphaproteobacteria bacterium]
MTTHDLNASPETVHWGYFAPDLAPAVTVKPGERVRLTTVSGDEGITPADGFEVLHAHREILAKVTKRMIPGHTLTGPVAIEGAEPGDTLEVRIIDVSFPVDWGWNMIRPLSGALPHDFDEMRKIVIPIDRDRNVGKLPWGLDLPLKPFFGVMGVAPPPNWGVCSSIQPRAFGGNLDNKELHAGSTLFLPVFVPGALFSAGDGHAVQGDGEVCVTAIECCLSGTFEFHLHKATGQSWPRAETTGDYITMGIDEDLDDAAKQALREMIVLITSRTNLSREDAYTLCSLAADMRITQLVNGNKGVHCVLKKELLQA